MTTERYSVRDARAKISDLIKRAEAGERTIITRDGRPVAQLGPPPASLTTPASRAEAQARQRNVDGILGRLNRKKAGG